MLSLSVILEAKKEEANEMKDKERRSRNVIIHGVPEQSTNEDRNFVDSPVKEIRISVNIKRLARIELQTTTKQDRYWLDLTMQKKREKYLAICQFLEVIRRINPSASQDLTPQERKQFKELSQEAKLYSSKIHHLKKLILCGEFEKIQKTGFTSKPNDR